MRPNHVIFRHKTSGFLALAAAILLLGCTASTSFAAEVKSASRLAFGPDNTVFIADWKAAQIVALPLAAATAPDSKPFNLLKFDEILAKTFGTSNIRVEDVKARPGTNQVFLAVSIGNERKPALVRVTADGVSKTVSLNDPAAKTIALKDAPNSGFEFWDKIPERSFTVTDMKWHEGKLYVAGVSNQEFASTLRMIPYPFTGTQETVKIEIYHTSHDQIETRAPIRQMAFANLKGKPYLIAAYMCTPLVTIPLDELRDGAHVRGKTIAELGYGNTPNSLLPFDVTWQGTKSSYLLVSNIERNAEVIALTDVEAANDKPSMAKQVSFGQIDGVQPIQTPFAGVYRIDNFSDQFFIAARRELESGHVQLITIDKAFRFRLSDFVSEYNFPGYKYEGQVQTGFIKPVEDSLKKEEGYAVTTSDMPNGPFPYKKKQ